MNDPLAELRLVEPAYAELSDDDTIKQYHADYASDEDISRIYADFGVKPPTPIDELRSVQGYEGLDDWEAVEKLYAETAKDTETIEEFYSDFGIEPKPTVLEEFGRGMEYGWESTKALVADGGGALIGSLIGDEEMTRRNLSEYMETIEELDSRVGATVGSYRDIDSVEDMTRYMLNGIGQGLPSILPSLASGGVGYFTAKSVGTYFANKATKEVAETMAEKAIKRAALMNPQTGSLIGSVMGAGAQNIPESHLNLLEAGVDNAAMAIGAGALKSSLDVLPQLRILDKFFPGVTPTKELRESFVSAIAEKGVKEAAKGTLKGRIASEMLQSSWREGLTESMQEAIDIQAKAFVDENTSLFSMESLDQLIDSGLQGAMVGAAVGGGAEGISSIVENGAINLSGKNMQTEDVGKSTQRIASQEETLDEHELALFEGRETDSLGTQDKEGVLTLNDLNGTDDMPAPSYVDKRGKEILLRQDIQQRMEDSGLFQAQDDLLKGIDEEASAPSAVDRDALITLGHLTYLYPEGVPSEAVELLLPSNRTDYASLPEPTQHALAINIVNSDEAFGQKKHTDVEWESLLKNSKAGREYLKANKESWDTLFTPERPGTKKVVSKSDMLSHLFKERNRIVKGLNKQQKAYAKKSQKAQVEAAKRPSWLSAPEKSIDVNKKTFNGEYIDSSETSMFIKDSAVKSKVDRSIFSGERYAKLLSNVFSNKSDSVVDVISTLMQRSLVNAAIHITQGTSSETSNRQLWHYLRHGFEGDSKENKALNKIAGDIVDIYNEYSKESKIMNESDAEENFFNEYVEAKLSAESSDLITEAEGKVNLARIKNALKSTKGKKFLNFMEKAYETLNDIGSLLEENEITEPTHFFKKNTPMNKIELGFAKERDHRLSNVNKTDALRKSSNESAETLRKLKEDSFTVKDGDLKSMSVIDTLASTAAKVADSNALFAPIQALGDLFEETNNQTLEKITEPFAEIAKNRLESMASSLNLLAMLRDTGEKIVVNLDRSLTYKRDGVLKRLPAGQQAEDIITIRNAMSQELQMMEDLQREILSKLGADSQMSISALEDLHTRLSYEQEMYSDETADQIINVETIKSVIDNLKEVESLRKAEYAPYVRFGDNAVFVFKLDKHGNREGLEYLNTVEKYDTFGKFDKIPFTDKHRYDKGQMAIIKKDLDDKYRDSSQFEIVGEKKPIKLTGNESSKILAASGSETLEEIINMVGDNLTEEQQNDLRENVMKKIQAHDQGFQMKRTNAKKIAGWSTDWNRVIPQHHVNFSRRYTNNKLATQHNLAKKYIRDIKSSVDVDDATKAYIENYYEYVHSPLGDHVWLRKANFMLALGGNLSTAALQVFNLPLATFPTLVSMGVPAGKAMSLIGKHTNSVAFPAVFRGFKKTDINERGVNTLRDTDYFNELVVDGIISQSHADMLKLAVQRGILNPQIFEAHSENVSFDTRGTKGAAKVNYEKILKFAGVGIGAMEQLSRLSTLSAIHEALLDPEVFNRTRENLLARNSYNQLRKQTPMSEVSDINLMTFFLLKDTHGRFDKSGRGFLQKGIMGSVVTPFVTHPITQLELLGRFARSAVGGDPAARAAMIWMLGGYFMISGLAGMPGEESLEELYELVMDLVGKDGTDFRTGFRMMLVDDAGFSPRIALMMMNGMGSAFLGSDASTRITMPLGFTQPLTILMRTLRGDEKAITRLGGPSVGMLGSGVNAIKDVSSGKSPITALRNFEPIALRNFNKAVFDYGEGGRGERTRAGVQVMDPESLTMADRLMKGVGFTPTKISEARFAAFAESQAETADDRLREVFVSELVEIKVKAEKEYRKHKRMTPKYKRLMAEYHTVRDQMKAAYEKRGFRYKNPKTAVKGRVRNILDPKKYKSRRNKTKNQKRLEIDKYTVD